MRPDQPSGGGSQLHSRPDSRPYSRAYSRLGKLAVTLGIVVTVGLTVVTAFVVEDVESEGASPFYLPDTHPYVEAERRATQYFHGASYLLIIVEATDPLSNEAMRRVDGVVRAVRDMDGVLSVHALPTVHDVQVSDGLVERPPLVDLSDYDPDRLRRLLTAKPLYNRLFLTATGDGQFIYVLPEGADAEAGIARALLSTPAVSEDPKVFAYAASIVDALVADRVVGQFVLMAGAAAMLVFAMNLFFFGALPWALAASGIGILPAFWVLGTFAVLDVNFSPTTSLAPIMVLILSTTYAFHVLRVFRLRAVGHGELLRQIGLVVLGASGTSILGMASLFVGPEPQLHVLAWLVIVGVTGATGLSLIVLPWIAQQLPAARTAAWERLLHRIGGARTSRRLPRSVVAVATGIAVLISGLGALRIGVDYRASANVAEGTPLFQRMQRYTAHTGGLEQLQLIVDSGEEYGFVDPERVASAERIAARLLEHAEVAEALSIVPFLRHTHATLTGADAPTTPTTSRHVAEALETLEQGQQTLRVSSLIDAEWRRIRYFLWFAEPSGTTSSAREALVDIRNTIEAATALHVPESSWTLVGPGLYRLEAKQRSVRGLVGSIALFLAVAGIALAVTLRSPRSVFAILLPPLLALIGYFGISGWIGAQLSVTMLFASIVILGVGNDDALYFTLSYRRFGRQAADRPADGDRALMETYGYSGIPIVQTTLLIIVGCAPLLLSDYSTLRIMAFLIPVGMLVSTAATLLVTPRILRQNRDRIRRAEGFDQGGRI